MPRPRSTAAEVKLDAEYATPTQHHNPIELFTTTCVWNGDELTIYEPSQFVYGLKNGVAQQARHRRRTRCSRQPFVGGAFGSQGALTPRTALVALAAKKLNRPVKLVADPRPGLHHRDLSRRDPPPASARRQARRQDRRLQPRRLGGHLAARSLCRRRRRGQRAAVWLRRGEDRTSRWCTPTATRRASCARRRSCPTSMRSKARWTSSPMKLDMDPVELRRVNDTMTDADRQALVEPLADGVLRRGRARPSAGRSASAEPGSMRDGDWLIGWGCATAVYPTHIGAGDRARAAARRTATRGPDRGP